MGSNLHLEVGGGVLPMATVARGNLARLRRLLNNCGAARAALPHLLLFDATIFWSTGAKQLDPAGGAPLIWESGPISGRVVSCGPSWWHPTPGKTDHAALYSIVLAAPTNTEHSPPESFGAKTESGRF